MGRNTNNKQGSSKKSMPDEGGVMGKPCYRQGQLRRSKRCNSSLEFRKGVSNTKKEEYVKNELEECAVSRKRNTRGRKRIASIDTKQGASKKKKCHHNVKESEETRMKTTKCHIELIGLDVNKSLIKDNCMSLNKDQDCSKKKESKKQIKKRGKKNQHIMEEKTQNEDISSLDIGMKTKMDEKSNEVEDIAKKETSVKDDHDGSEESDDDEWEEVEELECVIPSPVKSSVTNSKTIEITLDTPSQAKKRKKEDEWEDYFRREINRYNKKQQITFHKAHLLCLLALGQYRFSVCSSSTLQALCMSVLPNRFTESEHLDITFLIRFVRWFQSLFQITSPTKETNSKNFDEVLCSRFEKFEVSNETELVHIFASLLQCLQLNIRMISSLQPVSLKSAKVIKIFASLLQCLQLNIRMISSLQPVSLKSAKVIKANQKTSTHLKDKQSTDTKLGEKMKRDKSKKDNKETANDALIPTKKMRTKNISRRTSASKVAGKDRGSTEVIDLSQDDDDSESDVKVISDPDSDEDWTLMRKRTRKMNKDSCSTTMDSDSDFEPEVMNISKAPKLSAKKKSKRSKKVIASDSDESVEIIGEKRNKCLPGSDVWVEVFLESDKKWICIDCIRGMVNHPEKCESYATQPLAYVLSFSRDGSIKDLTKKYASKWMTHTRKLRIDYTEPKWWHATLEPFRTKDETQEETENRQLQANLLNKPMPVSISEFKNHPLYALKRHLLKFEAIYPESATILGYCRCEAVYSRDCVHELHAKEAWIKEARVVRIGEKPYKLVKARQKPHQRKTGEMPPPLPIYGYWQTEEYMAPPAVDGKIPRNEHGNIELYKPSMLPVGTVHLQIPGLNKVARKLDIDCAPAVVGWEFHCGYSHPVFDGFIVCEEFKETLVEAWEQEQVEIERKRNEKRELRVLKNWRRLTKALMIRERLKRRFQSSYEDPDLPANPNEKAADIAKSWPLNRNMQNAKDTTHLFPFEKL